MPTFVASPNVWSPPPDVIQAGERASIPHRFPQRIVPTDSESQFEVWSAVKRFRDIVVPMFPGISSGGLKRSPRKPLTVGRVRDTHEEGRAVDMMTRDPAVGDPLANWLVTNAQDLGIQLVMWRGTEWSASNVGDKWERIEGNEHRDHVHLEFSPIVQSWTPDEMQRRVSAISGRQVNVDLAESERLPDVISSAEDEPLDEGGAKRAELIAVATSPTVIALGAGALVAGLALIYAARSRRRAQGASGAPFSLHPATLAGGRKSALSGLRSPHRSR